MNCRPVWSSAADNELTEHWLNANSALRAEINRAVHDLEELLSVYAPTVGESRDANRRIIFVGPLHFIYQVFEQDRVAKVLP